MKEELVLISWRQQIDAELTSCQHTGANDKNKDPLLKGKMLISQMIRFQTITYILNALSIKWHRKYIVHNNDTPELYFALHAELICTK